MAQARLYDWSRAISVGGRDGVFFQADVTRYGLVTLYNRANRFTYAEQTIDGRPRGFDEWIDDVVLFDWLEPLKRIVREGFSAAEISRIQQGESIGVALIICPQTGRVIEVFFSLSDRSGYATVPVSTFRRIELALKEQIRFTPTADGRRMNYIYRFWNVEAVPSPSRRSPYHRLISPTPPPPDNPPPGGSGNQSGSGGQSGSDGSDGLPGGNNNRPPYTDIRDEWRP